VRGPAAGAREVATELVCETQIDRDAAEIPVRGPLVRGLVILLVLVRLGRSLARAGKEHVRKNFLTPRLLRDWLQIFKDLK